MGGNKEKAPIQERKEAFIKIPLTQIRFEDPYEQLKLENLMSTFREEFAVEQLEDMLKNAILTVKI